MDHKNENFNMFDLIAYRIKFVEHPHAGGAGLRRGRAEEGRAEEGRVEESRAWEGRAERGEG